MIGTTIIHQELLRRAITTRHPALYDFVETLAPTLLVSDLLSLEFVQLPISFEKKYKPLRQSEEEQQ